MMGGQHTVIKQNLYMRAFRKAEATDRSRAKTLAELGIRETRIFRGMVEKGVFVPAGRDAYYMDQDGAAEFIAARRKRAFYMLVLALIVILLLWIFSGKLFL